MSDDRPAVYEEDGKVVYRASALGACTKQLVAWRLGYEPAPVPASMLEIFDAGNRYEEEAVYRLTREKRWSVVDRQKEFDLHLTNRFVVRCHIDGRVDDVGVLEIKSSSGEEWDKLVGSSLWEKYRWQFSAIAHATKTDVTVVRINRDDVSCPLDVFQVQPHPVAMLLQRVLNIETYVYKGELPDCDPVTYPCPFYRLHTDALDLPLQIEDEEIDLLAKEYDKARGQVKRWEGIRDVARRALRLGIVEDHVSTRSGIRVRFSQAKVRRVSEKLMKDRGWDPEEVKEETVQERMTVTMPKEDGNGG